MELVGLKFKIAARSEDAHGVLSELRNRVRRMVNTTVDPTAITLSDEAQQAASQYTHLYNLVGDRVRSAANSYLDIRHETTMRPATYVRRELYKAYGVTIKDEKFWAEVGTILFRASTDRIYEGVIEPIDTDKGPSYYVNGGSCWWPNYGGGGYCGAFAEDDGLAALLRQDGSDRPVGRAWVLPGTDNNSIWIFNHYGVGNRRGFAQAIARAYNSKDKATIDTVYPEYMDNDDYDDERTFDVGYPGVPYKTLDKVHVNDGAVERVRWP